MVAAGQQLGDVSLRRLSRPFLQLTSWNLRHGVYTLRRGEEQAEIVSKTREGNAFVLRQYASQEVANAQAALWLFSTLLYFPTREDYYYYNIIRMMME